MPVPGISFSQALIRCLNGPLPSFHLSISVFDRIVRDYFPPAPSSAGASVAQLATSGTERINEMSVDKIAATVLFMMLC